MKLLIAGDTHGYVSAVKEKIDFAKTYGADRVLVVGDWGHWPGYDGIEFLDSVNSYARAKGIHIFTLGGNHEWWDDWYRRMDDPGRVTCNGFVYVRSHILYAPKVHNWKWDNKRFFICGGAVSIDRRWRTEGKSWWSNETFSDDDLASVEKYKGPAIDYMFTHDASNYTPWGFHLVPDPDSQENRHRIDQAIRVLKPRMQFHGHMHHKYEWDNFYNGAEYPTKTYGLDCNTEVNSWGVLDTTKDTFRWPVDCHV